jgi:hypothetical protein
VLDRVEFRASRYSKTPVIGRRSGLCGFDLVFNNAPLGVAGVLYLLQQKGRGRQGVIEKVNRSSQKDDESPPGANVDSQAADDGRPPILSAFVEAARRALRERDDPAFQQRRLTEIEDARRHQRGPKLKIDEAELREQIRLHGGAKARKKSVRNSLGVDDATIYRWMKAQGFLDWKEVCWYYSKY